MVEPQPSLHKSPRRYPEPPGCGSPSVETDRRRVTEAEQGSRSGGWAVAEAYEGFVQHCTAARFPSSPKPEFTGSHGDAPSCWDCEMTEPRTYTRILPRFPITLSILSHLQPALTSSPAQAPREGAWDAGDTRKIHRKFQYRITIISVIEK